MYHEYMSEPTGHRPLSQREYQLFDLAANGFTDVAIANRLGISEATVATYWSRIRVKYGPLSRPELIAHILKERLQGQIDELRDQNSALIKELKKAGSASEPPINKSFCYDIIESAADAIIVVDREGTIDWVNGSTLELFGYGRNEIVGKSLLSLLPEHFRKIHSKHVTEFFEAPGRGVMAPHETTFAVKKDGSEFEFVATLSSIETETGPYAVCFIRPVLAADIPKSLREALEA